MKSTRKSRPCGSMAAARGRETAPSCTPFCPQTKSGVPVEGSELVDLARFITESCKHLKLGGLMTIGAPGDMSCFDKLVECRQTVAEALEVDAHSLELSMGMSGDFEEAIARGSTSVRVGSTIFGARQYKNKT